MTTNSPSPTPSVVVQMLEDAKAVGIELFDMSGSPLADWFVVATGEADRHIDAMAESLRFRFKSSTRHTIEGQGSSGWVLIDLGDIVVHLLTASRRRAIGLDELWAACKVTKADRTGGGEGEEES